MKVHSDEDLLPYKNRKCARRSSQSILSCGQSCGEVILIYHRLLALFCTLFQTARTLYFLWAGGHYSQRGAYSWRGDTSKSSNALNRQEDGDLGPPASQTETVRRDGPTDFRVHELRVTCRNPKSKCWAITSPATKEA